ncbi:DNA polymerase I [Butyrivibrio sp. CB08]|uniref:DNA polymerase I n=1 Tax=Butyrivibrio sp. CB08 TaxID=2364879 RepID=UPI000EA8E542|nr:DNA polymerase I [Butyrivibrio sp. CB08]RKM57560.1 DNA polymerase I [Butyrivibrio sp. CB08]
MSDNKLLLDGNKLIRDAFYAIPDFTDSEGNHISGLYGAFFKLKDLLSGSVDTVEISFDSETDSFSRDIIWQIEKAKEILTTGGVLVPSKETPVTDELKSFVDNTLAGLSPSGEVKEMPKFKHALVVTSDLNEVEDIFKKAGESELVSYFFEVDKGDGTVSGRKALGLSLCFDDETAYYIPVVNFITEDYLGRKLQELSSRTALTTFDIKESFYYYTPAEISERVDGYKDDDSYLSSPRCFDVLIGAYLNNPLKNDYEIWDISSEYLGIPLPKKSEVFGKSSLSEADESAVADYMGKTAFVCFKAAPLIRKKLSKTSMEKLFYNIEMPLSYILFAMEKEGIIAKKDALKEYGDKLSVRIAELEKMIYEAAGCEFNINSPKQLGEILFEKLGLPAEKKTKSGYSTAADVLEKLAPDHKIVADVLEYRGLAKLKSTYADGLAAFIESDGRIHTSFNQTITATGRISSTEPNLQNIPMRTELGRLIRKVFVPKDGCVFTDADYSQIELRILAHMSEDQGLISAYHEGDDIHRITASKVFHVPFEEVTPLQRRNAKAVNFGIVYGMSNYGLSQDLSISVSEAKEYMSKYFETYPGVRTYQDSVIQEAKNKGYSETLFGRRRPIPELKAGNFMMRQFGERVAMNAPIQGTAADIMKIAMINVYFRIKRENLSSRLILQIHDELVIETYASEQDIVSGILVKEMEAAASLSVPLEVDCHTGSDWYEAK